MTTTKQKPMTGWVAWHPEHGAARVALSRSDCVYRLVGVQISEFKNSEEYFVTVEREEVKLMEEGWQFRPVEMRFTDKGEG